MRQITATIKGVSPYAQGRFHNTEKLSKESHDAYEKRTWRERLNYDKNENVFIPPMAFKNCVAECAKYLSIQIPGKGKATYTKHFKAGLIVPEPLVLPIKKDDVAGQWMHVPSDGRTGGTKRVLKCFPVMPEWGGDVTFLILDDTITIDVFKDHLRQAGQFIGVGSFRPINNGYFGRFEVVGIK